MREKVYIYFLCFLFYSFIGWLYEVLLGIFVFDFGFVNRGFLFGPYCPVYGFGALLIIFLLERYKTKSAHIFDICCSVLFLFLAVVFITTIVELLTSYLMEFFIGEWLWDYHNYAFNFQGRIALSPSIRFGIGGVIFLYVQPILEKLLKKLSNKYLSIIFYVLFFLFFIDCIARIFYGSNF